MPPACSLLSVAKAASKSCSVLASRIWSCNPSETAAVFTSLIVGLGICWICWIDEQAEEGRLGTTSCNSSKRFGLTSLFSDVAPATFPPGIAAPATSPRGNGISSHLKDYWDSQLLRPWPPTPQANHPVRRLQPHDCEQDRPPAPVADHCDLPPSGSRSQRCDLPHNQSSLGLREKRADGSRTVRGFDAEVAYYRHRGLLRSHSKWPRRSRATKQHELATFELTELHSLPQPGSS